MKRLLVVVVSVLLSTSLNAQVFPEPNSTTVNDFADIIDEETEARLSQRLGTLAQEIGTEMSIITLSSVQFYANDMDIGAYATALFNTWGIGNSDTNDGVLVLIFRDDRELRIELGTAYGTGWNDETADVIDKDILPQFRLGNFGAGIEAGVNGLIENVVMPFHAPTDTTPGDPDGGGIGIGAILGGIVAVIAGLIGYNKFRQSRERCDACGKTGLTRENVILKEATKTAAGAGERRVICPHCGHIKATPYTIPMITDAKAEKPSHGGGKSDGGGGETGKW